ncbi:very short patch repair endonuclease [Sphingobium chlorophenolicum]|uniref:very short patch repair endonuclease n=1 Tax=Sphingobium chlorophenolicum TaxID=46429 RepID=UPI00056C4288|nr:DNA mismatch endonuclease Vsr [Sphingobium chlorophenolicum]
MPDTLSPEQRSARMALIRHKNTKPEHTVRRILHKLGYRFRLHANLPGKPDIVFSKRRMVIFVHGCFWHSHAAPSCTKARIPKSNQAYWVPKLRRNTERDMNNITQLESEGWQVMTVWECQLQQPDLAERLRVFLGPQRL